MIEIIKKIIDLIVQFINYLFDFKIDFVNGQEVKLGIVVVAFVVFVLVLYYILRTVGIVGGGEE